MKFMDKDDFEKQNVFGTGQANTAYAKYFIGDSFLNPLTDPKCGLFLANVTFEPGCRNNWHIHHATKGGGQMLICTAGEGWYQEEGKEPVSLEPGTVIAIPPEVKHWHGAKKDSWFSHIAAEIPGENTSNEWCEPVTDEEYNRYGNERVVGGPKINTAFLEAGLLDEISLLVGAGIDGRGSMPAVFDGLAMQHDVTKLKLIDVKKFDSDAVWIRYQCQKSRRQIINNMLR